MAPQNPEGRHVILELLDCDPERLNNESFVATIMRAAAQEAKATIVSSSFHTFNPQGISGVVIIAESHLTIHTWPEWRYAAVDIFTCGNVDIDSAVKYLVKGFDSLKPSILEIKRGVIYDQN